MSEELNTDAEMANDDQDPVSAPDGDESGIDVSALRAEMDKIRAALKKANAEAKAHRLKAQEMEAAQAAAQRSADEEQGKFRELYEAEQSRAAKATAEAAQLRDQIRGDRIAAALTDAARAAGFAEPGDVARFVDLALLDLAEDGTVENAAGMVAELASSKPYLLARSSPPNINTQTGVGNAPAPGAMTEDDMRERSAKYGISVEALKDFLGA